MQGQPQPLQHAQGLILTGAALQGASVGTSGLLLAYALATGRVKELRPTRQGMAVATLTGSLMVVMWASFFAAIQWTSIALATVTFHLQPLWLLLAGTWLEGRNRRLAGL